MVADLGGNFAHGPGDLRVVFDGLFRVQEGGTGEEVVCGNNGVQP